MARRTRIRREIPLPAAPTLIGAMDLSTRRTLAKARTFATSGIQALLPQGRTGTLKAATRARVRQVPQGYVLKVVPSGSAKFTYPERRGGISSQGVTARQVAYWVEDGTTGPIVPRRSPHFRLPGGWVSGSVSGQRAQRPFERFRHGPGMVVQQMIVDGARDAAREMARVIR